MRYTGFGKVSIFGKSPHPVSNLTQGRNSGFLLPANLPEAKGRAAEQTLAPICARVGIAGLCLGQICPKQIDPVANLRQGQGRARDQAAAISKWANVPT